MILSTTSCRPVKDAVRQGRFPTLLEPGKADGPRVKINGEAC